MTALRQQVPLGNRGSYKLSLITRASDRSKMGILRVLKETGFELAHKDLELNTTWKADELQINVESVGSIVTVYIGTNSRDAWIAVDEVRVTPN